jgi:hypothetical protein
MLNFAQINGTQIILTLKVLVSIVTVLFAGSLIALLKKKYRLHGIINTVFFALTMLTVVGFEILIRLFVDVTTSFSPESRNALKIHLFFSVPAALILPIMFFSGKFKKRKVHVTLGIIFTLLWIGTFITGVFTLPHQ